MSQSISRRSFLKCAGSGAVSLAAALLTGVPAAAQQPRLAGEPALLDGKAAVELLGYAPAQEMGNVLVYLSVENLSAAALPVGASYLQSREVRTLSDLYSMGYLGHIAGTPMVAMKQRHKIGSTEFILPDDTVYIFAGDTKPVKRVTEGEVTMLMGDPMNKTDLTQEFLMTKRTGISIILDRDFGSYKFA